ncbi:MAG TPA: DUF6318 family protein [Lapillicoccus sp.]|nr:DUF6318 family protein [Lapillicoccus sp.]
MGLRGLGLVRLAIGAAIAVVVGAALGGCDVLEKAARSSITAAPTSTSATETSRPSPSTTTTTRPPAVMPDNAKQKTKDGARAFTIFFWSQFNRSQTEPNPTLLRPLYADSCAPCAAYTNGAQALKDRGQRYDDPPFRITKVTTDTLKGDTASVITEADQKAVPVVDAQGTPVATATERDPRFLVTLSWNGSRWLVGNIEVIR